MDLTPGQVAVVTGGASGIGLGLAQAFGAAGLKLMIGDIEEPVLETARRSLEVDGFEVEAFALDVADPLAVDALAEATFDRFGAAHVVCNNAGVLAHHDAWGSLDDWDWVFGVDFWGVVHGVRSFVPLMLDGGEPGHVVNTASVAGLLAFPGISSYTAAKHAVVGLSQSMYHELAGTSIGVSVLCPGVVATNIVNSERNRPGVDPDTFDRPSPELTGEVLTPDAVADQVVAAVRSDRFWVLPHAHYVDQAIELADRRKRDEPPLVPRVRR